MAETLDRTKKEKIPSIPEHDILYFAFKTKYNLKFRAIILLVSREYLAFAMYKQGNLKRALIMTERLYEIRMFLILFRTPKKSIFQKLRSRTSTCKGKHQMVRGPTCSWLFFYILIMFGLLQ
jgi:hypothetical protein